MIRGFLRLTFGCLSLFVSYNAQANPYKEYNSWYAKDGVMYDMTQTSDGQPVMISIYAPGKSTTNMVISYYSGGNCQNPSTALKVDASITPTHYSCITVHDGRINHFAVSDVGSVNYIVNRLRSGFTVILQDEIKIWAANFNTPKFGIAPDFLTD